MRTQPGTRTCPVLTWACSIAGALLLAASLGSCAASGDASSGSTAPGTVASAPTASGPSIPAVFSEEKVDANGVTIRVSCAGKGPKTVVFVSGLGEDGATGWGRSTVPKDIAAGARVCTYDRPGLGASSAATTPRTVANHVLELAALVDKGTFPAPVVLVAQGYGTFIARQFAKDHVRSVAGMVLVDPPLNELRVPTVADATPGQQAEFASIPELNANLGAFGAGALPPPPAPSIVLGAGPLPAMPDGAPLGSPQAPPGTQARDPHLNDGQNQLARKSPFGSFVLVSDAGSYIQYWKPDAVVTAIRSVLDDPRGGH